MWQPPRLRREIRRTGRPPWPSDQGQALSDEPAQISTEKAAIQQQAIDPEALMQQDDQPEHQLERQLARLVAKHLLRQQGAGPATQQFGEMQVTFRGAPAA
ncbi:hypothetical protein D3C84_1112350 [compost metagenome]